MKKYKAAIIGCGNVASLFDKDLKGSLAFSHAGAYKVHPRTDLIAACDLDEGRLKEFSRKWGVKRIYSDYKKMLGQEDIDILSVCTTPSSHFPIVCHAAKAPLKAIYCEKPITLNSLEAVKMIKACRQHQVLLMVNHQRRFGPFWREVKAKFDQGFLGDIQQVTCYYTRGIYNTGVHILDLFSFLFGKADWVMASISKNISPIPNDPNIDGLVHFKSGLVVHLQPCNDANYLIFEFDILGSKGRLRIGHQVEYFKATAAQNLLGKNELMTEEYPFKTAYGPISLIYGVEHIINCLEKRENPLSSGTEALQSLGTIEALLASAKNKKPVKIGVRK